jgi:hypothetical protein
LWDGGVFTGGAHCRQTKIVEDAQPNPVVVPVVVRVIVVAGGGASVRLIVVPRAAANRPGRLLRLARLRVFHHFFFSQAPNSRPHSSDNRAACSY